MTNVRRPKRAAFFAARCTVAGCDRERNQDVSDPGARSRTRKMGSPTSWLRCQKPARKCGRFRRVAGAIGFGSMVLLRCTQKLLVRLKQADEAPPVESTTRLGDWYGNILRIGHRRMLIFISERSRLPVVIPMKESKRLDVVFPDVVCEVLAATGVSARDIASERLQMSEIAFGPTRNRSLLGTLNDFANMARFTDARRAEPESPEELMRFLARTPMLPLNGANPIDLTLAAFRENDCVF